MCAGYSADRNLYRSYCSGVALMQLTGWLLDPVWERIFGGTRDLERFSDVAGLPEALMKLMALNWTPLPLLVKSWHFA